LPTLSNLITPALMLFCALALMALEAFIPGVSIAGVIGAILIIVGGVLCWSSIGAIAGILFLLCSALLSFLIMQLIFRSMKHGRLSRSGMFLNEASAPAVQTIGHPAGVSVGSVGTASTALRPSGIADFDGRRIHVVSASGFIEAGSQVTVTQIKGSRITVKTL